MGTGKTTVGRRLAERLGFRFVDTDELIEERHGPIPEIFANHGEAWFRSREREVASELARRDRLVISTGGGLLLDPANEAVMAASGRIICLVASVDEVLGRVTRGGAGVERPLLQAPDPRQRIKDLMAEREAAYSRFQQVRTDQLTPEQVVQVVLELISRPV